ncbi:MAG: Fic family protein [Candidatus Marinimicrobia bacterium]|nr:Fic family protein [Candidatus Neomarinimicrobiota bacterium]
MKPFIPHELPPDLDWKKLVPLIGKANAAIARYDGLLQSLINPSVLLSPITTNEAVLSSRIEGTQASLSEVLEHDAGLDTGKSPTINEDIKEISNYRKVLRIAEDELKNRPISLNFVKSLHAVLLDSVRGKNKEPGQFRKDQNWIGKKGTPIETARFVPPSPLILQEHLEKWEKFLCRDDYSDPFVQLAIVHAQFEILHPFIDGNGRIGRLFIPLFLYMKKCLNSPMFYLSEYLETHRDEYYDGLLSISSENNWHGWIEFFLQAIVIQSDTNISKAKEILSLYDNLKDKFIDVTHSQYAVPALDTFFKIPIINTVEFYKLSGIPNRMTANNLLRKLVDSQSIILLKQGQGRQPSVYAMPNLINIAEGRKVL